MTSPNALLIFAKAAVPGRVKTRLLPALSAAGAAEIQKACITDTLRMAGKVRGCDLFLFGAGGPVYFRALAQRGPLGQPRLYGAKLWPQRGRDLGERLENAFHKVFRRGYRRVVVIGTDTPWMGAPRIGEAFRALAEKDVVLGPCRDGGYYLLGLRRFLPEFFRGIPWGTSRACRATLRAARRCGAKGKILRMDFDLDRPGDLRRAKKLLSARPERAPNLSGVLVAMGNRRHK
ncbi:MAG TPA: TIGR04282 family arsenosugar biosynthesis glycosyltransferase [Candidatus Acidoferrales bacterium]|nr:TIGR04282 family arsenosugar biosynthesis glycosyltransferase [Candidatus Acidoferrales bacterium]